MKQVPVLLLLLFCFPFINVYSQCEPDTANCKNEGGFGAFCPKELPAATINQEYNSVITVIPPGEVTIPQGTFMIEHVVVDSVINFPPGISYESNADKYYADSAYCIKITGTPTEAGSFPLTIYVTPYVNLLGTISPGPQVENDTSVIMLVENASGIVPDQAHEFKVHPNAPNPFMETTMISFYTPYDQIVELRVYNILGEMLHYEHAGFAPGEHSFIYDGAGLQPGTYIYRVTGTKEFFTGKFIKARM